MPMGAVEAAGAVVTRRKGSQVLLVHRPKYDDWSFPKGKLDEGEHATAAAVREVREETGLSVRLGRPLPPQVYGVAGGRTKTVHYWVGRATGRTSVKGYCANNEIDGVGWFDLIDAEARLTYHDDVALLEHFVAHPKRTTPLVILRHAKARPREGWDDADDRRPLARAGETQAEALVPLLRAYDVSRVLTSPSRRCVQTVKPYADAAAIQLEDVAGLSEEDLLPAALDAVVADVLGDRTGAVVCTHRPVLPELLGRLGVEEEPLAPSELVVCHHRGGRIVAVERHLPL